MEKCENTVCSDKLMSALKSYVDEFKKTQQELERTKKELSDTKNKLNSVQNELHDTKEELDSTKDELYYAEDDLSNAEPYNFAIEFDGFYKDLPRTNKDELINLFKEDLPPFFCMLKGDRINTFYDYIKKRLVGIDPLLLHILSSMFKLALENYLKLNPEYIQHTVCVGDKYDPSMHCYVGDLGEVVDEIIITGWKNSNTNECVRQSIVTLDE